MIVATRLLPRRSIEDLDPRRRSPVADEAVAAARPIVEDVRVRGEAAVREHAERFGELPPGGPLFLGPDEMRAALEGLPPSERERLERVAGRIRAFADAQRSTFSGLTVSIPGGRAGHWIAPVERAGCYAPGGRYPLPSSVLMTALTAQAAGVPEIWVASPRPGRHTLAAAALAGAHGFLAAGGAQAIAALAYGAGPLPPCDVVAGPGNRYVTAAKLLVAGQVAIDMLAGPSELVILADAAADPATVAADLLAQAEHDPEAVPVLVSLDAALIEAVEGELARQIATLPSRSVAEAALANGGAILASSLDEAIAACDRLAPEHLEVCVARAAEIAPRLQHYGAIFIGDGAAEVLGDYGAGPNHVLPTGGTARSRGGLSVFTFLRVRTWLQVHDRGAARQSLEDAAWLGRVEGLEAHARSAERRLGPT